MTVHPAFFQRRHASSWLIAIAVFAAVVALLPVVAGIIVGGPASPRTARVLASAPSGLYLVFSRSEEREDVILAAPAGNPSDVREIARIEHLPGYAAHGAVSPDGARLALVTADAGTRGHPGASLIVVTLATGGRGSSGGGHRPAPGARLDAFLRRNRDNEIERRRTS